MKREKCNKKEWSRKSREIRGWIVKRNKGSTDCARTTVGTTEVSNVCS